MTDDLVKRARRHREQFAGSAVVVSVITLVLALLVAGIVVWAELA